MILLDFRPETQKARTATGLPALGKQKSASQPTMVELALCLPLILAINASMDYPTKDHNNVSP